MTDWRFILITIVLTKTEDFLTICGKDSENNFRGYYNESVELEKRLPDHVLPEKYAIAISVDFRKDVFHGSIGIDIEILKARNYIVLHAKNLTIISTKLYSKKSKTKIPIHAVYHVNKHDMLVIRMIRDIPTGEYSLKMNFTGDLQGKMSGFYLSSYVDVDHTARKLAVTQFEPFYARNAFPCFDEPHFKSTFHIRLVHSEEPPYHALSNMPITKVGRTNDKDAVVTYFDPTPPMSSYLVAFVISDLECLKSSLKLLNGSKIPLSVCVRPMYKDKVKFALNVAVGTMEYYLNSFKIDYPLPKVDLVAIPDFAAGAMENWGLVTFRETELLHSENDSSCSNMKSVGLTVAHELAHMWFGDLVTIKWWNDLWLNEGFATYMEHLALDYVFPEWNQMNSFPLSTKYVSMKHDTKMRARPIVKRVEDPEEIEEMFDRISYQKASSVIRMLEDAVGNSKFLHGIRKYLQEYQFRNAESRELFEILRDSVFSAVDIVDFMNRWTRFPGFPVINIRLDNALFRLSQRRFAISKKFHETFDDGSWTIPIRYITSRRDGVKLDWFLANYSCVELILDMPVDWIKLNHDSIGYYVVNYTEDAWTAFAKLLSRDYRVLSAVNRADLLHDAFILGEASDLCYCVILNLTSYLVNETSYQPWAVVTEWFGRMSRLLDGTHVHAPFQAYARHLVDRIYSKVGWRVDMKESFKDRELGALVLNVACSVGHDHCLEIAGMKLRSFLKSNVTLPADIRSIVYSFGLVTQPDDVGSILENMSRLLETERDVQERDRLMIALTAVQDEDTLNRYLERAIDEKFVRKQDFTEVIIKIAMNPAGLNVAWNFVRSRWDSLVKKYSSNSYTLGKCIIAIISLFKDRQKLQEARFFLERSDVRVTQNGKRNAIEEIENNIDWLDANARNINRWLEAKGFH